MGCSVGRWGCCQRASVPQEQQKQPAKGFLPSHHQGVIQREKGITVMQNHCLDCFVIPGG